MTRTFALLLAASAAVAAPALAQNQQEEDGSVIDQILDQMRGVLQSADSEETPESADTAESAITAVLAAPVRDQDRARDQYRHPAETLAFFRVEPGMRIAEYSPGGGWYTRILAPLAGAGLYHAVNPDSSGRNLTPEQRARVDAWPRNFASQVQLWSGYFSTLETAFESDDIPEDVAGHVDRVLIFRNIHSILNGEIALSELANIRRLLADDGLVGVVQHRAPESETWERANGSRGYVKQSDVIALFDLMGFELVDSSEINANPADPADWDRGVWTLPPVLAGGEANREEYLAIGESDRMTLLFRKAD
jgi:predicted methyltransferase